MAKSKLKLAVFDMDGVLTQSPSSWEFVHGKLGVNNHENLRLYRENKLTYMDFLKSDVRMWIARCGRLSADVIVKILNEVPLRDGITETLKAMDDAGIRSAIVSGGIYWLAERIDKTANFLEIHANKIKTDADNFLVPDGEIMVDPKRKDLTLRDMQNRLGIEKEETVSIGDTSQDIAMFWNSGLSIAFNPVDEKVSLAADFSLTSNNLLSLLDFL